MCIPFWLGVVTGVIVGVVLVEMWETFYEPRPVARWQGIDGASERVYWRRDGRP